jgi:hypothetical protein
VDLGDGNSVFFFLFLNNPLSVVECGYVEALYGDYCDYRDYRDPDYISRTICTHLKYQFTLSLQQVMSPVLTLSYKTGYT